VHESPVPHISTVIKAMPI